jgi:CheY-like chemotaxis protein
VNVELEDTLDVAQDAVKVHLFQAIRELLFNVAKHSGTDTARVAGANVGGLLGITVADAGKGFDPAKVFDGGGVSGGCGLFSVRERILGLGGDLRIESAPGRGTSVTVLVPVANPSEIVRPTTPQKRAQRFSRAGQTPTDPKGSRARVLIADDHDLVRTGVVSLLSQDPRLEVVGEARNGREAVALARQLRPDVVVMDIRMPEMDGIEATRVVLSEAPDTIVIGITAFGDAGFRVAMLAAGAADLLEKEEAGAKLSDRIAECLAGREVQTAGRDGRDVR